MIGLKLKVVFIFFFQGTPLSGCLQRREHITLMVLKNERQNNAESMFANCLWIRNLKFALVKSQKLFENFCFTFYSMFASNKFNFSKIGEKVKTANVWLKYKKARYDWEIQGNLFAWTNQYSTISHARENSKFNITSKYVSFLTIDHLQAESRI